MKIQFNRTCEKRSTTCSQLHNIVCSSYLVSGDADGKCYIWDWKTTKLYKKWKAHDGVCITSLWHPHEPSKLLTAGWDGVIKYWD
ncbi:hypothetical protein HF086_012862 [Spodoptera exigua]|uniref:Uncharacterized protein n=1 Tax=Spodoptera exigua TaxID=7107 RepID=A0A922MVG5_SPOEX|nr:hypothetical protein HF086_012862 [Spodoptera exigua]